MLDAPAYTLAPTDLFGTSNQYGSKIRAFASPQTRSRFLRIVWRSGRDCSSVARWLIDEALSQDLMADLAKRAAVRGHEPGGSSIVFRLPPRIYYAYKDLARQHGVHQASVSHLLGLALERALEARTEPEWIQYFRSAEDLVDRVLDSIWGWLEASGESFAICTK